MKSPAVTGEDTNDYDRMPPRVHGSWHYWLDHVRRFAGAERGRKARMAAHLGVTPQRLNHWLNGGRMMPGWAVIYLENWYEYK